MTLSLLAGGIVSAVKASLTRDYRLDLIRTIAIICVVLNHAVEQVYPVFEYSILEHSLQSQAFCFCGWIAGRSLGVPLFFFLTGYLLLPREYSDKNNVKRFYKHNLLPLLLAWEVWILIYQIFICIRDKTPFNIGDYLKCAFFVKHAGLPHTWYIPVILGVYLFLPFISVAIKAMTGKILAALVMVVYIYIFLVPGISLLAILTRSETSLSNQLHLAFGGEIYGWYIVLGYCLYYFRDKIDQICSSRYRCIVIALVGIMSYTGIVFIQLSLRNNGSLYTIGYGFFLVPIVGTSAFIVLTRARIDNYLQGVVTQVSLCAFGIYCIHEPIIQCLYKLIDCESHNALAALELTIFTFALSFLTAMILSKIKFLKWLVLRR